MSTGNVPLEEHASYVADFTAGGSLTYQPTEEEKKTIKLVNKLFGKAKKHRKRYDDRWLDFYKMFRGKQWFEQRPSYRHSEVVNLIFQNIQSIVPIQTDARPKIDFVPTEPQDREFAEILNDLIEADWEKYNWLFDLTEVIYDAHLYGIGMSSLIFDAEASLGMGEIKYKSADPFYCYPDPEAKNVNADASFFIYAEPKDVEWVKRRHPKHAEYIKADLEDPVKGSKTDLHNVKFKSPTDTKVVLEGSSTDQVGDQDKTLYITCWIKSEECCEEEETKEDGSKEYVNRLKYPKGRKIIMCSNVLIEDGENPYDDGLFPYSRHVNYILPREYYGISEVEQLESPQKVFNRLLSFTLDVLTLMGNPVWIVDTAAGIDTDNLINRPGLIIEKEPGSEVRREEGVQLQPYVLQLIDRMKQWFDDVSGTSDVSRGIAPGGVTANSAIENLQDASQTRIRQKMRNLDMYLKDVGNQYVCRALQFYTVPRVFRLTNKDGVERYFRMAIEHSTDEAGNPVKKARLAQYEDMDGSFSPGAEKEFVIRGSFDVRASTGTSLPFTKAEREQKFFNLFDRGIIDAEEVLKGIDFPKAEAILERMAAKQQQQAAMGPPPKQ